MLTDVSTVMSHSVVCRRLCSMNATIPNHLAVAEDMPMILMCWWYWNRASIYNFPSWISGAALKTLETSRALVFRKTFLWILRQIKPERRVCRVLLQSLTLFKLRLPCAAVTPLIDEFIAAKSQPMSLSYMISLYPSSCVPWAMIESSGWAGRWYWGLPTGH